MGRIGWIGAQQQSMAVYVNRNFIWSVILILQHILYLAGRAFDDMSWYDVGIKVGTLETFSLCFMLVSVLLKITRKYFYEFHSFKETMFTLFGKSQLKFIISWSLTTLNCFLFYNIFLCLPVLPEDGGYFYVDSYGCSWNMAQIVMTNLLYSLAANNKTLFGEMIYNGSLLIVFIDSLVDTQKDFGLLYIVLVITNQILIMILFFGLDMRRFKRRRNSNIQQNITLYYQ